jgi:hypothetical protein
MGATDADRQRRYRARQKAHRAGDHSLCADSKRCDTPGVTITPPVTRDARAYGDRGARLWREMSGDTRSGGERALVEEACRIADRLDELDGLLAGGLEALLRFKLSDDGADVTVVVNNPLAEARQQAAVLKQIVSELRQSAAPKPAGRGAITAAGGPGVATGVADLTTRIAERRAQAQG